VSSTLGLGMKRTSVLYTACLGFAAFVGVNCSQAGPGGPNQNNAGAAPMTQAGAAGTPVAAGGATAGAGAPAASAGAGGAVVGTGGASGGATAGGGAPAAAGASVGGSSSGGQPAAAGAGGTPGAAGGGGLTPADIVPGLHGYYWEGTCAGSISVEGHNCPMSDSNPSCPSGGINREKALMVKGTTGTVYTINIEVRGVIGTRCYKDGMRASSAAINESGNNNWWYIGGVYANQTGWWNTYELHVTPSATKASGEDVYYFNGSGVMGGNDCEREATYLVNYKASFQAKGGSTLTLKVHDQNCKGQQNCGSNPDPNSACMPRTVDLTGMSAMAPSGFTQPPANNTYKPQWMLIGVTSITSP